MPQESQRVYPTVYMLTVKKVLEMGLHGDVITAATVAEAIHRDRSNVNVILRNWTSFKWLVRAYGAGGKGGPPPYVYTVTPAGFDALRKEAANL